MNASLLLQSSSAKSVFVATVASSLDTATAAEVTIISISPNSKNNNRRSLESSQQSATVRFKVLQQLYSLGPGVNATALYKTQVCSSSYCCYNFKQKYSNIIFLGPKSQQLLKQVSSGGFTSTMQMKARSATPPAPLLIHANCSIMTMDPFAGVIFITNSPSISPDPVPVFSASKTSSNSYGSWPLYGQVGLAISS